MEKNISEEILKRLNDPKLQKAWEYVSKKFGITPDSLSDAQKSYLANGASSSLVTTNLKDKEGKPISVSLRFGISEEEVKKAKEEGRKSSPDRIFVTLPEETKTKKNCFNEDGSINPDVARFQVPGIKGWVPITSSRVLNNLLSVDFVRSNGKSIPTPDFANAGVTVKTPATGDKEYLISLNRFTNTFVAVPTAIVNAYVRNINNLDGVALTDESKRNLCNGKPVVLQVTDKEGNLIDKGYQFDVAKMMLVEIPLVSANKTLKDIEMWRQKPEQTKTQQQEQQPVEKTKQTKKETEAKKTSEKKGEKKAAKVNEAKAEGKKEVKGKKIKI